MSSRARNSPRKREKNRNVQRSSIFIGASVSGTPRACTHGQPRNGNGPTSVIFNACRIMTRTDTGALSPAYGAYACARMCTTLVGAAEETLVLGCVNVDRDRRTCTSYLDPRYQILSFHVKE